MIQLIYVSTATVPFMVADLKELLRISRVNNRAAGVSGMLVYDKGSFLQILEGKTDSVIALYDKIERDKRHSNIRLLLRSSIGRRSFGDWQMGFYDGTSSINESEPGYVDFFSPTRAFGGSEADRAKAALLRFRAGAWRGRVNIS